MIANPHKHAGNILKNRKRKRFVASWSGPSEPSKNSCHEQQSLNGGGYCESDLPKGHVVTNKRLSKNDGYVHLEIEKSSESEGTPCKLLYTAAILVLFSKSQRRLSGGETWHSSC